MEIDRQVRYNTKTGTGDQELARHRWTFLIINTPDEISRIRERIYQQLKPMNHRSLDEGLIVSSGGIHYDFFSFSSERGAIPEPSKIFRSNKLRKDRNLYERDEIGLEKYLNSIIAGKDGL
ncbi:MAG: hypothetical protein WAU65_02040 [Candidatus Nanoarchaeia archaeon]